VEKMVINFTFLVDVAVYINQYLGISFYSRVPPSTLHLPGYDTRIYCNLSKKWEVTVLFFTKLNIGICLKTKECEVQLSYMWVNMAYPVGMMMQQYNLFQTVVSYITESENSDTVSFIVSTVRNFP
jgi:hypothetical protein